MNDDTYKAILDALDRVKMAELALRRVVADEQLRRSWARELDERIRARELEDDEEDARR